MKHVKNVKLFFMYFIAGLDYTEHWCSFAEKRWGVEVHRMMSWATTGLLHDGSFCNAYPIPRLKMIDTERAARQHFGWQDAWVATGMRLNDSLERRGMLNSWASGYRLLSSRRCAPIAEWSEREVYAYLQRARLPIPDMGIMERTHGFNLQPQCMYWMRKNWPDDYKRVLKVFPLAAGQADRYERYGEEWKQQKKDRASKVRVRRSATQRVEAGCYNPRKIDPYARKLLKDKLEKVGCVEALVWNRKTGNLISGHQRLSILDELEGKADYVVGVTVVNVSEKREKELNVFLNNASAQGRFDEKLLADVLMGARSCACRMSA